MTRTAPRRVSGGAAATLTALARAKIGAKRGRRALAALLAALVVTLCLACSPGGPAAGGVGTTADDSPIPVSPSSEASLVPDEGVYLGVYYGDRPPAVTDAAIGRTPQIHLTYFGWNDPWTTDGTVAADVGRGQLSLVNWEPFGIDFADVVAGRYDRMLARRAVEAARLTKPVFLDFAAEMNEEEGWGDHDPELYVAAYRHVHDLFEGNDGGNVVWVWAPNNVDSEDAPEALDYYPGDAYVDWTGIDGYNWGTSEAGFDWQSFRDVFGAMYDDLHTLGKPIIVAETSSDERGGSKAQWITEIVPTLRDDFPDIRALVWFDVEKERDWRIRSSAESSAAFQKLAADELFAAPVR